MKLADQRKNESKVANPSRKYSLEQQDVEVVTYIIIKYNYNSH